MSYCRFSSDDYQCDVYVYGSDMGYETHVAGNRLVYKQALPDPIEIADDPDGWHARHQLVMDMVDDADRVRIDLEHAGKCFVDGSAGECAERLKGLKDLGYEVPQYVIDALVAESHNE